MAMLKRLSDSIWSYVSPRKPDATAQAATMTPHTVPRFNPAHQHYVQDTLERGRSVQRVKSWRSSPPTMSPTHLTVGPKRKRELSPPNSRNDQRKVQRIGDMDCTADVGHVGDTSMGVDMPRTLPSGFAGLNAKSPLQYKQVVEQLDLKAELDRIPEPGRESFLEEDEDSEESNVDDEVTDEDEADVDDEVTDEDEEAVKNEKDDIDHTLGGESSSPTYLYEEGDENVDRTIVASEEDYTSPGRRKFVRPDEEYDAHGVSTEELRAAGWDDDYITLKQRIAMRGLEPLLPQYYKWDFSFLPDALFAADDSAFVSSVHERQFRGIKALDRLLQLGGHIRDRKNRRHGSAPEAQARKQLNEYIAWLNDDCGLDSQTAIPVVAIITKPAGTEASVMQNSARSQLEKLADRYKEAFRARPSIEISPCSVSTTTSHSVPQLYAVIAFGNFVALTAYRPGTEQEVRMVAHFDFSVTSHDVWNSLGLAIILNHGRNVQLRIAKETGLGLKVPGQEVGVDDPDL